jgi:hypothetical protein
MKYGQRLVDMLRPDLVDLVGRRRVAPFGIAAMRSGGEYPGDTLD